MNKTVSAASNSFSYSGEVNVSLRHNGVEFPYTLLNHGTKYFLDALSRVLAGYKNADQIVPRYFDYQSLVDGEYKSCLTSPMLLSGAVYGESADAGSDTGKVRFNLVITFNDKSSLDDLTNPRIVLLNAERKVIAEIQSETLQEIWDSIESGTEALMSWTMIFMNGGQNSES